jgi:M-phase phosphoprotein 6
MWKPGSAKPSKARNARNNSDTPPAAVARSQTSLSGATLNMRFMQRKNEQQKHEKKHQQQTKQPPNEASPKPADNDDQEDPMQVEEAQSPLLVTGYHAQHHPDEDSLIDTTPATTSDMYGISMDIIGRRSFGGFNRALEDTWKSSYRAQKDGTTSARKAKSVTDEELLSRYANLVKQRNNHGEDASRRPVGNLGEKVRPRKQMNDSPNSRNSGEKRKRS